MKRITAGALGVALLATATAGTAASAQAEDPETAGPTADPAAADVPFPEAVEPIEPALPEPEPAGEPDFEALEDAVPQDGPATEAPARDTDDGPRTGFEERGGAEWTTLEEERKFLRDVAAASDRVTISEAGRTVEDRPLDLVQIAAEPRTPGQVAAGSNILIVCTQHGNEPAGREACLQSIRNLAFDDSPATNRLLQRSTILVVPTVNPDGVAANTRQNADGVDVNRDHLELATPEAQSIARIVRDYQPQVVHDAHEYGGTEDVYDRDLIYLWPRNLNVDSGVRAIAREHSEDYIDPIVQYEGFTTGVYGLWYGPDGEPIAQVAGDEDERIMRNTMGLKHRAGQLIESRTNDFTGDETPTEGNLRRVRTQLLSLQATYDLTLEQRDRLLTETRRAAEDAAAEGAAGDQPFFFAGADNALPSPDAVDLAPPCAYTLTAEQFDEIRPTLRLHGVETSRSGGEVTVSMAQAAQPLIPLLLDERANFPIAEGTPVACS